MNAHRIFQELFIRHESLFEEAAEAYAEHPGDGLAALDVLCETLELTDELEEMAEEYVRGNYDPFA